ncbi:MAG: rod shape-determining protein MreC [Opitutaceae bacterium]|nr:rod shape-determining protein MreC [Opitutaceae bacterium]
MPSKRFDQAKPFAALGIVVLAWLLLPVVVKSFLRVSFFEMQAPIQAAAAYARDLQEYWTERAHSKHELIRAGKDLRHVYAGYEFQVQQADALRAEIARLEQLLRLPSNPNYRFEPARVARRDLSGWWQQLVIRKGANFGIPVGAPVVYSGGVVGRVREVHAYTAVVDLITSPSVRLAANIGDDSRPVSYQGGLNPPLAPARGLVEFVPPDIFASATTPKRLVTSGLGGVFPAGLTIGSVTRLEASTDGLFKSGEVALDPRLSELTEVTVLVPLNPE